MKKKLGNLLLAGALTIGGVSAVALANPTESSAASQTAYGVSINTTKTNYYLGTDSWINLKMINNNDVPVHGEWRYQRLVNGAWKDVYINEPGVAWMENDFPAKGYLDQKASLIEPTFPKGTYRVQLQVYSSTGVFKDEVYTDLFYVK